MNETGNQWAVRRCSCSPPLKLPLYTWKYLGFVFCLLLDHKLPEISLMQDLGQNRPSVTGCCLGLEIR